MSKERTDWLAARRNGIGASESAALFGLHPYISALSLYESKIRDTPDTDDDENERMEDGKVIEPRIAARWEKATGRRCVSAASKVYRHAAMHHMTCTPDMLILENSVVTNKPLELKWLENFSKDSEIPEYIQIQCQHQVAVLEADASALAVLGSFRSFHHFDIPRHDEFISLLMEKVDEFWKRVQERRPPDADGSDATAAALKRLFPRDSGATIFLPAEAETWATELAKAKEDKKDAETREALAKHRLVAAIGDATIGRLPDGSGFSYKHQVNAEHVVAKAEFRVLRRVKAK